uniref:Transposon MuDR mudrA n=1 Tax=Solanum tuberosum TaxID=4113 RepID=M1DYV3_SOLTU
MLEEEFGAAFNKVGTTENRASENIEYNEVGEAAFNGVDVSLNTTSNIPSTSNTTAPYTNLSDSEDSDYSVKGSNESTEESDDSEDSELLEDDQYGSDVHDELIQLRAEKRSFLRRRKRRERIPADTEKVPCGNAGADLSEPVAKKRRGRPKSASASVSASASASASKVAPRTTAPPKTSRTPRHEASASASRAAPRTTAPPTTLRTPTDEASASVSGVGVSSRPWSGRGRGRGLGSAARSINHPLESWFTCSQGCTTQGVDQNTNVAPKETVTTRKGKGVGNTAQFKRPRVTGMGVFQAENGFKTFNPGLPSSRILAGPKRVLRSNVVTGDVGFKPTSGLKWKGNQAITTRRLQQIRDQSRLSNPNASSSSQPRDPWKL